MDTTAIQSIGLPLKKGMVLRIHPAVTFPSIQESIIRITDLIHGPSLYEVTLSRAKEFVSHFAPKGADPEYTRGIIEKYAAETWVEFVYLPPLDPDTQTPAHPQYLPLTEFSTLISIF